MFNPNPANSLLSKTKSANTPITSSSKLSTTEFVTANDVATLPLTFSPVPIAGDRRAMDGENAVGSEVTKIKLDPLLNLSDLGAVGLGGSSTVIVLTIGGAVFDDRGLITTSPPSNVNAESFELSSVSALT